MSDMAEGYGSDVAWNYDGSANDPLFDSMEAQQRYSTLQQKYVQLEREGHNVPWLTVYLALLFLAFTAITQPSGRVCGFPAKLRTWLRSSPIICIVDVFTLLLTTLVRTVQLKSLKQAADEQLAIRYRDRGALSEIQKLETYPIVRWVLIVLPAVVQNLKLLGTRGIPWSKVWVYCYALSVVMLELCFLLPRIGAIFDRGKSIERQQSLYSEASARPFVQKSFSDIQQLSGILAILLQCVILIWATDDLIYRSEVHSSSLRSAISLVCWLGGTIFLAGLCWIIFSYSNLLQSQVLQIEGTQTPLSYWAAILSFVMFVENVVLGATWYALRYNALNTYSPTWVQGSGL